MRLVCRNKDIFVATPNEYLAANYYNKLQQGIEMKIMPNLKSLDKPIYRLI